MILHSIEQNPLKETITHFYFIEKEACMYNNNSNAMPKGLRTFPNHQYALVSIGVYVTMCVVSHQGL